jgi:hypothetical protein
VRWALDDQSPRGFEVRGSVIIVEELLGIEVTRTSKRGRIHDRSGGVGNPTLAAVDAVRIGRQRGDARRALERREAKASAYSWQRPPRPMALRTVTDSSPPLMMAALRPAAFASRASLACCCATSRASPATLSPRSITW